MHKPRLSPKITEASADASVTNPLDVIRVLRPVSGELLSRMTLYAQLLRIEITEQKVRMHNMLVTGLLGFACLLCVMLFAGVLVMTLSWDSAYRIAAMVAVTAVYAASAGVAWFHYNSLSALSNQAFAATREEFAADIALIKSKL